MNETARRGRIALKLDTVSHRPRLRAPDEDFGFTNVGQRTVWGFEVTLHELMV